MYLLEICCLTCDIDLETFSGPWNEFYCLSKTNTAVTWSNCAVPPKEVKPPSPEAEMLNNVKNLHRFLYVADFRLLCDDEVDVNVGVDEVPIGAAAHGALDAHEAVLLHTHRAVTCHTYCCGRWAQGTAKAVLSTVHPTLTREKSLKHELEQKSWNYQRSHLRTKQSNTWSWSLINYTMRWYNSNQGCSKIFGLLQLQNFRLERLRSLHKAKEKKVMARAKE